MKPYKTIELVVYENIDNVCRVEYKGRVIQIYGYVELGETKLCHFTLQKDGNDGREFFCLLEAIRDIDKEDLS